MSAVRRSRGGTFTIIVIISAMLLLAIGGAFVEPARNLGTLNGLRERQEQAKSALEGSARWSVAAVSSWSAGRRDQKATLAFSRARVEVELAQAHDAIAGDATATVGAGVKQHARWVLARKGERWTIQRFELDR